MSQNNTSSLTLKEFKQAVSTAPLILVGKASAEYFIYDKYVALKWNDEESGEENYMGVNEESLKRGRKIDLNCHSVAFCWEENNEVQYSEELKSIYFYNLLEFPI